MSERPGRRTWSAAEKLRIALSGLQADTQVSELCRREGITAAQYDQWKDRLLGSAEKVFERKDSHSGAATERSESELRRLKDVLAEITAENLELKKCVRAGRSRAGASGVAAAGPGGSGPGEASQWLAGQADLEIAGDSGDELLPLVA